MTYKDPAVVPHDGHLLGPRTIPGAALAIVESNGHICDAGLLTVAISNLDKRGLLGNSLVQHDIGIAPTLNTYIILAGSKELSVIVVYSYALQDALGAVQGSIVPRGPAQSNADTDRRRMDIWRAGQEGVEEGVDTEDTGSE